MSAGPKGKLEIMDLVDKIFNPKVTQKSSDFQIDLNYDLLWFDSIDDF